MSFQKILTFFLAGFTGLTLVSHAQEPYFPPPSSVDYHNDTLTIFPPDSLPGDPAVLLGYNIYVDSVFYDDVQVDNQGDTVIFIPDFSTLDPGNHEFCAKAVYNLWISDPACDSAQVVYGYELPFYEDWSSGNFSENQWVTESGNWTVETGEGNPGPTALFSGIPAQTNYEIPLTSFAFRGDLMNIGNLKLSFDLKLNSINNTGQEKLYLQAWSPFDNSWDLLYSFSNQAGSFDWSNKYVYLYNEEGRMFKIRFIATGNNSSEIQSWSIDNIHITRNCQNSTSAQVEEHYDHNTVYWSPPTGCGPWSINWDDGINSGNSIGTGSQAIFQVAARWDSFQINEYDGERIHAISFFPAETQANYRVRIWTGDSAEVMIYDSAVNNPVIQQWNEIELDTLLFIDGTHDLWIGYLIEAQAGYPAGVDDGPEIDGYGNMIYWEDHWQTLIQVNPDLQYNWNIAGILNTYPEPPDLAYKIYREVNFSGEYQLIDQIGDWPYEDYDISLEDIYCYRITNLWTRDGDTCESSPSNEACEYIYLNAQTWTPTEKIKIYPNPASDLIIIQSGEPMDKIRIFTLLGEPVLEKNINDNQYILDVSGLKRGVYFLEADIRSGKIWKKIVIH
jgi:hypothetical protein